MYVCICQAVSDGEIRKAVAGGASTLTDLQERLGLGMGCGTCVGYAEALLQTYLSEAEDAAGPAAAASPAAA